MVIIADIFEPEELRNVADKVEDIKVDFYVVGDKKRFTIERKTWFDLISTLREDRLWNQLQRIKDLEKEGYLPRLLIEGNKYQLFNVQKRMARRGLKRVAVDNKQVIGLIHSILDFGVPIIYSENITDTKLILANLNKRAGTEVDFKRPTIAKYGRKDHEIMEDFITAADGIGRKSAEKLLKKFGNVRNVMTASEQELAEVIDPKVAKLFIEIIIGDYYIPV